jgi:DNA-binding GntR family transcriptional regulator
MLFANKIADNFVGSFTRTRMMLTIERGTEADEGYERLYGAILRGEFQPNERLIEMELAQRYKVGRAAIRTTLARLEQDGLVEREPNRGARVRSISEEEAVETFEARAVLEGLAARYAARNATDADIAALRTIVGEMEERLAEGDLLGISEASTRLHSRLLLIANTRTVARLIERLHAQHVRSQFRIILVPGRPPRSVAEHRAIVETVAARDPEAAEAAMRDHLAHVVEALRSLAAARPSTR